MILPPDPHTMLLRDGALSTKQRPSVAPIVMSSKYGGSRASSTTQLDNHIVHDMKERAKYVREYLTAEGRTLPRHGSRRSTRRCERAPSKGTPVRAGNLG